MKKSLIAPAVAALLAATLAVPPARAEGESKSAAEFVHWLGLGPIPAKPGATAKSASRAAYAARLRRQRVAGAKPEKAANVVGHAQVAASAQVVRTPPVAKTNASVGVGAGTSSLQPASGQVRSSLDCRQYIPTASMTISVACVD